MSIFTRAQHHYRVYYLLWGRARLSIPYCPRRVRRRRRQHRQHRLQSWREAHLHCILCRGSRRDALVCTAVERVVSKVFYHKYCLICTAKKVINTAIAVPRTAEAVFITLGRQTRPRRVPRISCYPRTPLFCRCQGYHPTPCGFLGCRCLLPPRLSTIFGRDFHVKLAKLPVPPPPPGVN